MKKLIAHCLIVSLTVASGASTYEESEVISKSFNYGNKDVIYSVSPFWKDELVYAVCDVSSADKKCKVYVESTHQAKTPAQSCDVSLTYGERFDFNVVLYNTGNSKAVFAVGDGDDKIKLISVKFDGCEVKEASVDVPKALEPPVPFFTKVVIVAHKDNYDVIFHNKQLCHDFLCKATFDYKGKVVKAVSSFPVRDLDVNLYDVKYVSGSYLVSELRERSAKIYLIHNEEPHTLFNGTGGAVSLSTEENELGYCTYLNRKLLCRKYDAEGRTSKTEVNVSINEGRIEFLDVLNLEKGLLALAIALDLDNHYARKIFVAHYDEQGKQRKFVHLVLKCIESKVVFPKLYRDSDGKYCVSSICMFPVDSPGYHSEFARNTRCFHEAELF